MSTAKGPDARDTPDVVYVVRPGETNFELRYSLRSVAAHVPHGRVWLAGHRPEWVADTVGHIPVEQTSTKYDNSTANLRAACLHPEVSEYFTYWNDDMFALSPVTRVPVLHRGRVADVERYYAARANGRYLRGLRATRSRLAMLGYPDPLSYELHIPMPLSKALMLQTLELGRGVPYLHKRTLYGNLWAVGGSPVPDVKVCTLDDRYDRDSPWLSTLPRAFRYGHVGQFVRRQFPVACRYEKAL